MHRTREQRPYNKRIAAECEDSWTKWKEAEREIAASEWVATGHEMTEATERKVAGNELKTAKPVAVGNDRAEGEVAGNERKTEKRGAAGFEWEVAERNVIVEATEAAEREAAGNKSRAAEQVSVGCEIESAEREEAGNEVKKAKRERAAMKVVQREVAATDAAELEGGGQQGEGS